MLTVTLALLLLTSTQPACQRSVFSIETCQPGDVVALKDQSQLSCQQLRDLRSLTNRLASASTAKHDGVIQAAIKDFKDDPPVLLSALKRLQEHALMRSASTKSLQTAEHRSQLIFELQAAPNDPWPAELHAALTDLNINRATSQHNGLVLTEMDVEGWILYASLCHEVQTGQPLGLSVAQRVELYRMTAQRFELGSQTEQVALVSMGIFWPSIRSNWGAASYATQQRWIARAPLPPIGDASALGYFEALLSGPFETHALLLHDVLAPLSL